MIFQFADDFPVRKLLVYQGHTLDHPSSLTHCWNSRRPVLGRGIPFNLHGWEIWKQSLQVRRSSLTRSLAKDQVLRGPLTFGLPRFDRAQPFFSSRSSSPSFFHIGRHCAPMHPQFFMVSEPQMTTENYTGSMLNLTWTHLKLLLHHWKATFFQSPSDHSP